MEKNHIKKIVKDSYAKVAGSGCGCSCSSQLSNEDLAKSIGYSNKEITVVPDANPGLGCVRAKQLI